MLSSLLVRFRCLWTDQLIRPCWFLVCFLGVFVCFVWFWVFVVFFVLHGDSSMEYVSIQFSSLLYAHCRYDWCCHCINSVNLHNAIVFRLDKRPDESHLALDGKKNGTKCMWQARHPPFPRNKKCRCCKESLFYFLNHCLEGCAQIWELADKVPV